MNNNTQHGRMPAPQQAAPPTDPRTRNHSPPSVSGDSAGGICRDFIWGICSMGAQCIYRHELEFEAMKAVLKFCHDHQNRTGCTRPDCTYLHTSREEQNLFLTTGQIPRVLIDRYTGISSGAAPAPPVSENVTSVLPQPHQMMYEYITQPPPPPPPPPTPATAVSGAQHLSIMHSSMQGPMSGPIQGPIPGPMQGPIPGPMQGPIPGPMQGPIPGPLAGPMHGPMPMPASMPPIPAPMQPPPPPPPPTSSVSAARIAGSLYTSPLPTQSTHPNMTSVYHPPLPQTTLPPMFDPTRPPPPIPQATPGRPLKRAADECEAGPSKVRKVELKNDGCECCVQRLLRMDQLSQQIVQLEQETEQARSDFTNKMFDYEKRKNILRSILSPDIFRRAEDYVENGPASPFSQRNEVFSPSRFSSPITTPSNSSTNAAHQLLEFFLGGGSTRGLMESMPSCSASDDVGLLPIHARARSNNGSSDFLTTLLDLLRNDREGARPAAAAAGEAELSRLSAAGNGYSRFLGGGASPLQRPLFEAGAPASLLTTARTFREASAPAGLLTSASVRPFHEAGAASSLLTSASSRPFHEAGAPASLLTSASLRPYADGGAAAASAPLPYADAAPAALPYGETGPPRYPPPPRPFPPPPAPGEPPAPPPHLPAARPHFSHSHFAPNNMPNPPYPGAALNQPPRPPMPPPNNPYFMGGRYPNQHYYPPYQ